MNKPRPGSLKSLGLIALISGLLIAAVVIAPLTIVYFVHRPSPSQARRDSIIRDLLLDYQASTRGVAVEFRIPADTYINKRLETIKEDFRFDGKSGRTIDQK